MTDPCGLDGLSEKCTVVLNESQTHRISALSSVESVTCVHVRNVPQPRVVDTRSGETVMPFE